MKNVLVVIAAAWVTIALISGCIKKEEPETETGSAVRSSVETTVEETGSSVLPPAETITEGKAAPVQPEPDIQKKLDEILGLQTKRLYEEADRKFKEVIPLIKDPELKKQTERKEVFNELRVITKKNIMDYVEAKGQAEYRWRIYLKKTTETTVEIEDAQKEPAKTTVTGWDALDDKQFTGMARMALKSEASVLTALGALFLERGFIQTADVYFLKAQVISKNIASSYPDIFSAYREREVKRKKEQDEEFRKKGSEAVHSYVSKTETLRTLYVSPHGSEKNEGTRQSPYYLVQANEIAQPGDTIILMDGEYNIPLQPKRSGEKGRWIVYRSDHPKKAVFTDIIDVGDGAFQGAINVSDRSYIAFDNITIKDVKRFVVGYNAHHIWIDKCHLENASAWEACRFRFVAEGIHVTNCLLKNGSSLLSIEGGNHHLVENNIFDIASHDLMVFQGVERSFIRRNSYRNPIMKLVELYGGRRGKMVGVPSQHVFIEHNNFNYTGPYPKRGSSTVSIIIMGKYNVIRRNVFSKGHTGLTWSGGPNPKHEDLYNWHNSVYHNVFYDIGAPFSYRANGLALILGSKPCKETPSEDIFGNQVIANNIIFYNHHYPCAAYNRFPRSLQIIFAKKCIPEHSLLFGNSIFYEDPDDIVIGELKDRKGYTLKDFEKTYPKNAWSNISMAPLFENAQNKDFRLKPESPCIDGALPLTATVAGGRGTVVEVADASFFTDGFGIIDPDVLRVGIERVKAINVDYENNRITLDRSISWHKGTSVTLDYKGRGPDIGAIETR